MNKKHFNFILIIFSLIFLFNSLDFAFAWTDTGGGDHLGESWTPNNLTNISGYHYNIGTFTISSGYTIYVDGFQKTAYGGNVTISATTINISGTLDASGRGFGGGGGGSNVWYNCTGGYGGTNGNGGAGQDGKWMSCTYSSSFGGGGGFYGNGTAGYYSNSGGKAFRSGGIGGTSSYGLGGFGGGAGNGYWGGAGGGGYSGGGGGNSDNYAGGGGGSYNNGTNQNNTNGTNSGDGYVSITILTSGKSGLVSTNISSTPFYTTTANPYSINLTNGQSQVINWTVNATGTINNNYSFYVYANQTSDQSISNLTSNWNVTITDVPGTIPTVSITYPTSTNYTSNVSQINYTATGNNLSRCWYSTNNGTTNSSDVANGTSFNNVISSEAWNNWIVYCNNTNGTVGSRTINFYSLYTSYKTIRIIYL
jgi:hypothetical protein